MKKILAYLLLFTGLNVFSQSTLIKLKQIEYGPGAGYVPITTSSTTAQQFTNTLPTSLIPSLPYIPTSSVSAFQPTISGGYLTPTTGWSLLGNSTATTNFLGTTNSQDLVFKTNNLSRGKFTASGDVYLGDYLGIANGTYFSVQDLPNQFYFNGGNVASTNDNIDAINVNSRLLIDQDANTVFNWNTRTLGQSTVSKASINFPLSSTVPSSPLDGDVYWDNSATFGGLTEVYNGTANYNHTFTNLTSRGIIQTFTSNVNGGGVIYATGSTHPVGLAVNQDLGQAVGFWMSSQTSGAVNGAIFMGSGTTQTTTATLHVRQGGGASILRVSNAANTTDYFNVSATTGNATFSNTATTFSGNISLAAAGNRISIKTGTGASIGTTTLSAGTVSVANTNITANSKIFITPRGITNAGFLGTTLAASTGFTISSSSGTDARVVDYIIIEGN